MSAYSANTDLELFVFIKEGRQAAFGELYIRYKEPLYFHARRMLGDQDEARDIVQDLFAAIWIKRETFILPVAVDAYLYGSIRNRILDFIAHKRIIDKYTASFEFFIEAGIHTTDDLVREKELAGIIQAEVSRLPKKMREIFELSRNTELSYSEIAKQLNLSEHTVKKQAQRAIKILRLKIKLNLFFTFFIW